MNKGTGARSVYGARVHCEENCTGARVPGLTDSVFTLYTLAYLQKGLSNRVQTNGVQFTIQYRLALVRRQVCLFVFMQTGSK